MTRRALLFVNARSRKGRDVKPDVIAALARVGIDVFDASDARPHTLAAVARKHRRSIDRVIVGGGDGTINRLLEPLLAIKLPLGIVPIGTANDLAATLGIPTNINRACVIIAAGNTRRIDLGWVNGKHFVNEGSVGITERISGSLDPAAKKRWGIFAITARAAGALRFPRHFRARVRCDRATYDVRTFQVTIGNGKRFGGLINSLDADIADHKLEMYSLEVNDLREVLRVLPSVTTGHFENAPGIRFMRGREFEIITARPRLIYTDGEQTAKTPAIFRVAPSALTVYARASRRAAVKC